MDVIDNDRHLPIAELLGFPGYAGHMCGRGGASNRQGRCNRDSRCTGKLWLGQDFGRPGLNGRSVRGRLSVGNARAQALIPGLTFILEQMAQFLLLAFGPLNRLIHPVGRSSIATIRELGLKAGQAGEVLGL